MAQTDRETFLLLANLALGVGDEALAEELLARWREAREDGELEALLMAWGVG